MSAQDIVDGVANRPATQKRGLRDSLLAPVVVQSVALAHPDLARTREEPVRLEQARRLLSIAYTACVKNNALLRCDPRTIVASVVEAAQLGLTVDGAAGHAYLVPYKTSATLQIGYRGFVALAYNSGEVERIAASVIREGDDFDYLEGSEPFLRHKIPLTGERGETIGAYAVCHLKGARYPLFRVMPIKEVLEHRDRSSGWQAFCRGATKSNPWDSDFDAMAAKTPIRMLAKTMPQVVVQRAAVTDEQRDFGVGHPSVIDVGALPALEYVPAEEGESDG